MTILLWLPGNSMFISNWNLQKIYKKKNFGNKYITTVRSSFRLCASITFAKVFVHMALLTSLPFSLMALKPYFCFVENDADGCKVTMTINLNPMENNNSF